MLELIDSVNPGSKPHPGLKSLTKSVNSCILTARTNPLLAELAFPGTGPASMSAERLCWLGRRDSPDAQRAGHAAQSQLHAREHDARVQREPRQPCGETIV